MLRPFSSFVQQFSKDPLFQKGSQPQITSIKLHLFLHKITTYQKNEPCDVKILFLAFWELYISDGRF